MALRSSGRLLLEARRSAGSLLVLIGVVLGGLTVAAIIVTKLTFQRPWNPYEQVRAVFHDAKGVFPGGDSVRIHGVVVGVVSRAELVNDQPVLTLEILRKYGPIYRNARLRIRPVTPLQDLYVDVTDRGTPSSGVAGDTYVIPASQTVTPVDISRILDTFNANTRDRLSIMLSELSRGLPDGGARLRAAFAQLAPLLQVTDQATAVLRAHQQDVQELVHNFGSLSAALGERDRALNEFIRAGDATTSELASNSSPLQSTLVQIAALLPAMRSSFARVRTLTGTLDPALQSLSPITSNLRGGLSALGQLGAEALPALKALRPAVSDLRTMAVQLAPTSRSLNAVFSRLQPEAPQLSHLTADVVPCLTTIRDFFNNTLSVFKYHDANGAFPRADEVIDLDTAGGAAGVPGLNTRPIPDCSGAVK
jgi:phospholipid/cholesterol/gamma-HCH transport system substrate-binding protein